MATSHDDLQRSLGRMEGNQSSMEQRMDRFEKLVSDGFEKVETSLETISKRLGAIESKEDQRKGAWAAITAIASVVSGVVAWVVSKLL